MQNSGLNARIWPVVRLGDIVEIVGGKPAPQDAGAFDPNGVPFVRMRDLGRYHVTTNLVKVDDRLSESFVQSKRYTLVPAGSILMPRSGSVALNHRAILGVDAVIVSHICALVPDPRKVDNRYLYYYLCETTLENITKKTTGLDAVNFSDLRQIRIPLPPLSQQRQFASYLDKADGVRAKAKALVGDALDLVKSEFVSRFGTPLHNEKRLPTVPLASLARIVTGNTPPRRDPENYGSDIEWIKSDNIDIEYHTLRPASEKLSAKGKRVGRTVPPGSTLVTCIAGSPSVIGNAALADREVAFNQQINAAVPNGDTDPYFLFAQFLVGKELIQASATKSMKGMVSKGKFQAIHFLRPDYSAQSEFGRTFLSVMALTERLRSSVQTSEAMYDSLTQRAFTYSPASQVHDATNSN